MSIRVVTWNLLAPEFAAPPPDGEDFYPLTREHLPWAKRWPRIVEIIRGFRADAVCLQEVSKVHWERTLRPSLEQAGFTTLYAPRPGKRPDGVALLFAKGTLARLWTPFVFEDGSEKSALLARLETRGVVWSVASVHLKWTADGETPIDQLTRIQQELAAFGEGPLLVAGDWNVDVLRHPRRAEVEQGGWQVVHPDDGVPTWLAAGRAERADGMVARGFVSGAPEPIPRVEVHPGLPSAEWPSDHLPLIAVFD